MYTWLVVIKGITWREWQKLLNQKSRFLSSLVRPLLWFFMFSAGFRSTLGLSITEPYSTYINYEEYMIPGLCGMILLFHSMQSALSIVYDREMGSMRILLTSPHPLGMLLSSKLVAVSLISLLLVFVFLVIVAFYGIAFEWKGYVSLALMCLVVASLLNGIGLVIAGQIKQLENFAGVMNFVIFPMFFISSALYPLWKIQESSLLLYTLCVYNPFTYAVELLRFALYQQFNGMAFMIVLGLSVLFNVMAVRRFRYQV
ncbi:ABC transporter permease [Vibrio mimicus]|nr:ABC transporter permease [Vibrio mimicus]QXC58921.1 ABC transporter permease [Vibrio mimicus]